MVGGQQPRLDAVVGIQVFDEGIYRQRRVVADADTGQVDRRLEGGAVDVEIVLGGLVLAGEEDAVGQRKRKLHAKAIPLVRLHAVRQPRIGQFQDRVRNVVRIEVIQVRRLRRERRSQRRGKCCNPDPHPNLFHLILRSLVVLEPVRPGRSRV